MRPAAPLSPHGRCGLSQVGQIAGAKGPAEEGPDEGLDPIKSTGFYRIAMQGGLDNVVLQQLFVPPAGEEGWAPAMAWWPTAGQPHKYYLSYMGQNQPSEATVAVPPDERYSATLIDTWNMTEAKLADSVQRGEAPFRACALPGASVHARRLRDDR